MKPRVLIGGGEIKNRETEHIDKCCITLTKKKNPVVVFIPIAAFDSEEYAKTFEQYYTSLNAKVIIAFISKEHKKSVLDKISACDIVYLSGGDTEQLINQFKKNPEFIEAIKKKIVVGMSAGALALSQKCLISKDEDTPKTKIVEGLGLIDFTTEVHFDGNATEILKVIKNQTVFAIAEKSCIVIEEKSRQYIGNVKVFLKDETA